MTVELCMLQRKGLSISVTELANGCKCCGTACEAWHRHLISLAQIPKSGFGLGGCAVITHVAQLAVIAYGSSDCASPRVAILQLGSSPEVAFHVPARLVGHAVVC